MQSYAWYASFSQSYAWHDSLILVPCLIHIRDVTHLKVPHDIFISAAWHIRMRDVTHSLQRTATDIRTSQHSHVRTRQWPAERLLYSHRVGTKESYTATRDDTVQHTAPDCNTLQTLQHTAAHYKTCNTLQKTATHCNTLQRTTTPCNTLQNPATHCNALQHTAMHCNTPQRTAAHRNALQHTIRVGTKKPYKRRKETHIPF